MLRFQRPPRSLLIFLGLLVGTGALIGHAVNAAGIAALFFFISSIDGKPSWNFWFGAPGDQDSGRAAGRFNSGQRVGATSPKEIRRLPKIRD